ncbi:MAG: 23S rRNA (adenine(2503)-C(2))-methyltransferase RlmN, partial [Bradymonadia bacterium]
MSITPILPTKNVTELRRSELEHLFNALGQPKFRAKQLYDWVHKKGVRSFDDMTNFPNALREQLKSEGYEVGRVAIDQLLVSVDGTRKLSVKLSDGGVVETVLIPMGDGEFTQCISSQVGCALDCKFCYTGTLGLSRHLTPGEMVDQVLLGRANLPEGARLSHIVYMGMGEPLHNFDHVVESIRRISDPEGIGLAQRRITVSSSGLVPAIKKLGETLKVNLAISLNAADDETRTRIMPINKTYNLDKLIQTLRDYPLPPRRKMTMEYVMLGGVNDRPEDAKNLKRLLHGLPVRVNLIPWNPFQGP